MVVDEAHRAGGEKVTHDHLTTLGAAKTLLLTGTPFNNTPVRGQPLTSRLAVADSI